MSDEPNEYTIFRAELDKLQGPVAAILCLHFAEQFHEIEWHLSYVFRSRNPWRFVCGPAGGELIIGCGSKDSLLSRLDEWQSIGKIRVRCLCEIID